MVKDPDDLEEEVVVEDLSPHGILDRVRANDPTLTIVKCPHWDDYCHTENILDGVRDMVWRAYMDYLVDLFVALQQNTQAKFLNLWMWGVGMKTIKSKTMTNGRNYRCALILRVFLL